MMRSTRPEVPRLGRLEPGVVVGYDRRERTLILRWKAAMQNRFEPVTIPRQWRILAAIPVNSQSKIDHHKLLAEFGINPADTQDNQENS